MKEVLAILTALCLLCAACTAAADMEIPKWESMPLVVVQEDDTKVEESSFEGEWVLRVAFAGTEYVDEQTLAGTYDFNFMPITISGGKLSQDVQKDSEEFVTEEKPYVFEAGQLQGEDFVVELLEDGNIVLSRFFPGEGDVPVCLSVFMVHPAE